MIVFVVGSKTVTVYPGAAPDAPVLYLNTGKELGEQTAQALRRCPCPNHTLITVSGLRWEHDLSPWENPPAFPGTAPFTEGANSYLQLFTETILPMAEKTLPGQPAWRALAGYSLAGLFAIYALFHTGLFSRAASISGSLWFPGFREYVLSHQLCRTPDCLYFSLGGKEEKTRNPLLRSVRKDTEEIAAYYRNQQIDTVFCLNPGSHYTDPAGRTAKGLIWLLSR